MTTGILVDAEAREKPWMVMVHGMSQDHRVFNRQVAVFRASCRILLVDLPGHGVASAVAGPYGIAEFAAHVEQALVAHGVEAAHYWGTHSGATVGLLLSARQPGRFRSLILEGPVVPGENLPVIAQALQQAGEVARTQGLATAIEQWWQESSWFAHMRANPQACRAAAHREIIDDFGGRPWMQPGAPRAVIGMRAALSAIATPALIYNGRFDDPEFLSVAGDIARLLPNAETRQIDNSGGFPAWENPAVVNRAVADFIALPRNR